MADEDRAASKRIQFAYRESRSYRTIHVGGAFGGINTSGDIFAGIFSVRPHLPNSSFVDIDEAGTALGGEQHETTPGMVREVEVGLLMDLETAKAIRTWLNEKITTLESAIEQHKAIGKPK